MQPRHPAGNPSVSARPGGGKGKIPTRVSPRVGEAPGGRWRRAEPPVSRSPAQGGSGAVHRAGCVWVHPPWVSPGVQTPRLLPSSCPVGPVSLSRSPQGRGGRWEPRAQRGLYSAHPEPECPCAGKGKGSATSNGSHERRESHEAPRVFWEIKRLCGAGGGDARR